MVNERQRRWQDAPEIANAVNVAWDGLTESPEEVIQRNRELTAEVDALRERLNYTGAVCGREREPQCSCCQEVYDLRAQVSDMRAALGDLSDYAGEAHAVFERLEALRGLLVAVPSGVDPKSWHAGFRQAQEITQRALDGGDA